MHPKSYEPGFTISEIILCFVFQLQLVRYAVFMPGELIRGSYLRLQFGNNCLN
jgi:hypothetical protein